MFTWTQLTHILLVIGWLSGSSRNKWFGNGAAYIFIESQVNLYVFVTVYLNWPVKYKMWEKYAQQEVQNQAGEDESIEL